MALINLIYVLYWLDNWINEGSVWTIEYISKEYIKSSIYNSLSGSTYTELPDELKNSMKVLILKLIIINAFPGVILEI